VIRFSLRRLVVSLFLVLAITGCSMTFDATRLGVPATMASAAGAPAEGQAFSVTRRSVYAFWGLAKLSDPSLQKTLAAQLVGGKQVADLRIRVRSKLSDIIITGLTLGLIVPRAVTIEGVIVEK
jgi:hypothetical protein